MKKRRIKLSCCYPVLALFLKIFSILLPRYLRFSEPREGETIMGLVSLYSPTAGVTTRLLPSSPRPTERSSFFGHSIATSRFTRNNSSSRSARNLRPLASGTTYQKTTEAMQQEIYSKDADSVFVAGATGKVGSRTVRELLKLGFRVRAGVRSAQRAETLVQSVRQMKLDASIGSQPVERLEIVECDLENQGLIAPAIGSASIVICCIGASEKEVFDVTGPYRIDYQATKNLIESATCARVDHFILLTSLGTNKIGFPAAILNLFWGVLIWKRKAEEALIASGLPYTIVRPGGMERPTDSYKETHNIVLANEDTYFGGQVSNLQVAELMAFMAKKRRSSLYKVVEVIAETAAPLTPTEMLLAKIPPQREIPSEPQPDPVLVAEEDPDQLITVKETPLSPYWAYEDLKPPTSPTPSLPSSMIAKEKIVDATRRPSEPNMQVVAEKLVSAAKTSRGLSPYTAYDDLRPPTSPSPNAPITITASTAPTPSGSVHESRNDHHIKQKKPSPRSPFTMYEDLKPPTSPVPSLPKY